MKKKFPHQNEKLFEIPRIKFVTGILIGLGYSITFYSLLYLIREAFRIFTATWTHDLWILSDAEVNFYNLFFAFISVIFGHSVCFTFWFNRPKKLFGRYCLRQTSIVNDQRVFTWYFLSWFSKLAVVFGIWFGTTLTGAHYVFSFYPEFIYLFVLIIIVLFFSSWTNIRLTYKKQSLKWLLTSILTVIVLSFGLSRINVIDYKAINESYLKNGVDYKYLLELPESDSYSRLEKRSLVDDIYIVLPKKQQRANTEPIIVINNQEIEIKELGQKVNELKLLWHESNRKYIRFNLHVHKEIKVEFIKQVHRELSKQNVFRISYAVVPVNPEYEQGYYTDQAFFTKIPRYISDSILYSKLNFDLQKFTNQFELKVINDNSCSVNGTLTEYSKLKEIFINQIPEDTNFVIKFHVKNEVRFSTYLKVLSIITESIHELRNLSSLSRFSKEYYRLIDEKEIKEINNKYPWRILEIKEELNN